MVLEFSVYSLLLAAYQRSVFVSESPRSFDFMTMIWVWAIIHCPCYGAAYILLALLLEHRNGNAPNSSLSQDRSSFLRGVLLVSVLVIASIMSPLIVVMLRLPFIPSAARYFTVYLGIAILGYIFLYVCIVVCLNVWRWPKVSILRST